MTKNYGGNMGSIIAGLVVVFLGFALVLVLLTQASAVNALTGAVTLENSGVFFGMIFGSLVCVLFGGYLVGKYVEKNRNEKSNNSNPLPPPLK